MFGNRSSSLIKEYAKNPVNNFEMEDYTVMHEESNWVCGDDIIVYLKLEGDRVVEYSFAGEPSSITIAAASVLAEDIKEHTIQEILTFDYKYMLDMDFEVSPRRRRAAVLPILAARNAIHQYLKDGKVDVLEDLIEF